MDARNEKCVSTFRGRALAAITELEMDISCEDWNAVVIAVSPDGCEGHIAGDPPDAIKAMRANMGVWAATERKPLPEGALKVGACYADGNGRPLRVIGTATTAAYGLCWMVEYANDIHNPTILPYRANDLPEYREIAIHEFDSYMDVRRMLKSKVSQRKGTPVGGHLYDMDGDRKCINGCGCWMGDTRSGGPEGIDPCGVCPAAKV